MKDLKHSYSDSIEQKKIALLGPCPPPLGGVAVHVKRVMRKYRDQGNEVFHFDTTVEYRFHFLPFYLFRLLLFLLWSRPDIVDFHTLYVSNSILELWLLAQLKKVINYNLRVIEHDCRHLYDRSQSFKKMANKIIKTVDKVICIGDITYNSYCDNKVVLPAYSLEAAFLPPDYSEEKSILATYPESLDNFVKKHRPLLVANAFQLSLLNGRDLYGFDLCIDLIARLKAEYENIGLVFFLAQIGDRTYFQKMMKTIKKLNIEEHIFIAKGRGELWPLLKQADVFVRPTLSDSFGISVAEALDLGVPAVASNVCRRQKGAILFQCGNKEDFVITVKKQLQELV